MSDTASRGQRSSGLARRVGDQFQYCRRNRVGPSPDPSSGSGLLPPSLLAYLLGKSRTYRLGNLKARRNFPWTKSNETRFSPIGPLQPDKIDKRPGARQGPRRLCDRPQRVGCPRRIYSASSRYVEVGGQPHIKTSHCLTRSAKLGLRRGFGGLPDSYCGLGGSRRFRDLADRRGSRGFSAHIIVGLGIGQQAQA